MELRHGYHHGRGLAQLGEPIEDSGTDLQFGDLAIKVTRHDAFTKQLETTHLGLDKTAPVIAAPLLPDFLPSRRVAARIALRALAPGRWSFLGLAFLRVGIIACAPRFAIAS